MRKRLDNADNSNNTDNRNYDNSVKKLYFNVNGLLILGTL